SVAEVTEGERKTAENIASTDEPSRQSPKNDNCTKHGTTQKYSALRCSFMARTALMQKIQQYRPQVQSNQRGPSGSATW
ncbi:MAG: hypothetical protein ACKPKO_35530, partial [Candidatus Fonsibacter sp.]